MAKNTGPFVQCACLCDNIIEGTDKTWSLIRLVDRFTVQPLESAPPGMRPTLDLHMFIAFKSGDYRGSAEISIAMRTPGEKVAKAGDGHKWPVLFNGDEHGVNFSITMAFMPKTYGLYWCDVLCNGQHMTSIPFKLVRAEPGESAADSTVQQS